MDAEQFHTSVIYRAKKDCTLLGTTFPRMTQRTVELWILHNHSAITNLHVRLHWVSHQRKIDGWHEFEKCIRTFQNMSVVLHLVAGDSRMGHPLSIVRTMALVD